MEQFAGAGAFILLVCVLGLQTEERITIVSSHIYIPRYLEFEPTLSEVVDENILIVSVSVGVATVMCAVAKICSRCVAMCTSIIRV